MGLSIFPGTRIIVDNWLGVDDTWRFRGRPLSFDHRATYLRLMAEPPQALNGFILAEQLLTNITATWAAAQALEERLPGTENWRFEQQLNIALLRTEARKQSWRGTSSSSQVTIGQTKCRPHQACCNSSLLQANILQPSDLVRRQGTRVFTD